MKKIRINKLLFGFLFTIGMFLFSNVDTKAESLNITGRQFSIYEVTDVYISDGHLHMKGWQFTDRQQNYYNKNDHSYRMVVDGKTYYDLKNHYVDMTDYFDLPGVPWCSDGIFPNYDGTSCNARYKDVGFSFKIPLSAIINDTVPELQSIDRRGNVVRHSMRFAIDIPNVTHGDYQYSFNTSLAAARFRITHTQVIVRQNPSPTSSHWGGNASTGVGTNLYPTANWLVSSTFDDIIGRTVVNGVSWYKVNLNFRWTNHSSGGTKWYGIPGYSGKQAWIPSTFTALTGDAYTIDVNKRPEISAPSATYNIKDWASHKDVWRGMEFRDREDSGNTWVTKGHSNIVASNATLRSIKRGSTNSSVDEMARVPGTYTLTYSTKDSKGFERTVSRTITITNNAPTISASPRDITVTLGYDANGNAWDNNDIYHGITVRDVEDTNGSNMSYNSSNVLWKNMSVTIRNSSGQTVSASTLGKTRGVYTLEYRTRDSHGSYSGYLKRTITVNAKASFDLQDFYVIEGSSFAKGNEITGKGYDMLGNDPKFPSKLTPVTYPAKASDPEDGNISNKIVVTNIKSPSGTNVSSVSTKSVGTHVISYKVTDSKGAVATGSRNIIVLPASTPEMKGIDRYFFREDEVTKDILLDKVTATDKYDGDIVSKVDILDFNKIDSSVSGSYPITYVVKNTSNKTVEQDVIVYIADTVEDERTNNWVRYIDKDYIGTLDPNSTWVSDSAKNSELTSSLNKEANDANAIQVWEFSPSDVQSVKEFGRNNTFSTEVNNSFLSAFGANRKK